MSERRDDGQPPGPSRQEREWTRRRHGEPPVEELLGDPIMALLWRRDRLDPSLARTSVHALRAFLLACTALHPDPDRPRTEDDGARRPAA